MGAARETRRRLLAPVLARAGSAYLAGSEVESGIAAAGRLLRRGHAVTLAYWPASADAAADTREENRAALHVLGGMSGLTSLAVKAPAVGMCPVELRRLAQQARAAEVGLVFDAHSPSEADATGALARAAADEGAATGVAVPARWARSLGDAEAAVRSGLGVRLVKGQWPDDAPGGGPSGDAELRAAFLALLDRLIRQRAAVTVATHDVALLDRALSSLRAARLPVKAELLLGLPVRRALAVTTRHRAAVRFYVAYGHPSLAYPLASVLHRPRMAATLAEGVLLGAGNQRIQQHYALRGG